MPTVYEIKLPGAVFKDGLTAMRRRLNGLISAREPMPISLFFDYFQLTANNQKLGSQLRARGVVAPIGGPTYRNNGAVIDTIIKDLGPDKRQITIYIGPEIVVDSQVNGLAIQFGFREADILFGIDDLPPEIGFGTSFTLDTIKWDETGVRYIAHEDGAPDHEIQIVVDPTLQDALFLSGLRGFRGSNSKLIRTVPLGLRALSDPCCGGGFQAKQPPSGPLCVNIHAKILSAPAIPIDTQIQAVNAVYAAAQITVHLASVETLQLPQLEDLQVGTCVSGTVTQEQGTLYNTYRKNAGPNDICVYWVRTMISATGNVIGCAAHPDGVPALSLMGAAYMTKYVIAHEIGHVLGLIHVAATDTTNLMCPTDGYNGGQPSLNADQIGTMRWSSLLFSC